jgi:hypothetical protein
LVKGRLKDALVEPLARAVAASQMRLSEFYSLKSQYERPRTAFGIRYDALSFLVQQGEQSAEVLGRYTAGVEQSFPGFLPEMNNCLTLLGELNEQLSRLREQCSRPCNFQECGNVLDSVVACADEFLHRVGEKAGCLTTMRYEQWQESRRLLEKNSLFPHMERQLPICWYMHHCELKQDWSGTWRLVLT